MSLLVPLLALTLAGPVGAAPPTSPDQWYAQGQKELKAGRSAQAALAFRRAAELNPSAANWRALGDALVGAGDLAGASDAYARAIQGYRDRGDTVTARALENKTAPYRQDAGLYVLNAATAAPVPGCAPKPARFEPASGLYLGMYVDETALRGSQISLGPGLEGGFAVYFRYFKLQPGIGEVFPARLAQAAKQAGGALHIALEPAIPLRQVTEATLLPFARAAANSGVPIFLRFAAEFNDPANEWSRDPALYRAKFRLVHDVMAREAPNVAMVWMAMPSRLEVLDSYYPGADAVDWVGLSLYSVPYRNGNLKEPTLNESPLDVLKPIYDKYACTHPIQVSEYGASHRSSAAPGQDFTGFALARLRELYWGAALKYPRLKNINWLNLDMLSSAFVQDRGEGRRNDYRLSGVPAKLAAFRELRDVGAFRTRFDPASPVRVPQPFPTRLKVQEDVQGALWVKTLDAGVKVALTLDGRPVPTAAALPYRFTLRAAELTPGPHTLELKVTSARGQAVLSRKQAFEVGR
ncbi:hypothetical protein CVO96_07750 [Deinococcus koreensis]|uniref:GH26 domain-containing protein n=1 Tax=Deinococcus koreensis TaxID=2054903 RepID=A0A2K3V2B3_9DEIO|nr:hypothetical protein CVO96_07750 [Deinococcus koreensis]